MVLRGDLAEATFTLLVFLLFDLVATAFDLLVLLACLVFFALLLLAVLVAL